MTRPSPRRRRWVDEAIAQEAQASGCRYCGGKLDVANFWRQPRGLPEDAPRVWRIRFSFCCRVEGCRRRLTPSSVRFLGPVVYLAVLVVVAAGLFLSSPPSARRRAGSRRGIDRRTWGRWLDRFDRFAGTAAGRELHARLHSGLVPSSLALVPRLWASLVRGQGHHDPPPWRRFLAHLCAPSWRVAFSAR